MGKTAFALNIAEYNGIDEKVATLLVSLEMSSQELGDRLLSSKSGVSTHRMRAGTLSQDDRGRIVEAAAICSRGELHVVDDASVSVRKIAAHARRLKRKRGLGLLVIDYLQLIDPVDTKVARQEQVAGIARGLKILARDLKIPVICLAQLNRQGEDRRDHRPRLSDLRESGAIEQDADAVLFVHREEVFRPENDELKGKAEIIVSKQRNGPVGTVELVWRREVMRFESMAPKRISDFDEFNERQYGLEFA
jgi:replicative DNA helicase